MPRYIDIDKMKKWTEIEHEDTEWCVYDYCGQGDCDCNECYYNNGGAEDVSPVVYAKWEERFSLEYKTIVYACSNCGATHSYISNYCPNCGAKMSE